MTKPIKHVEKVIAIAANAAWHVYDKVNSINRNPGLIPKWSDKPLLKSWEKQKPKLGWPRETDSLCPKCIPDIRQQILDGKIPVEILRNEKVGEIKANIIEKDGKIVMVKECPIHGHFEDLMSIDPAFSKHLEDVFPGRDIRAHNDETLHDHGTSTITHGRGSVLTIDLTNRCNMMCDPCFMDELSVSRAERKKSRSADNAISTSRAASFGAVLGRRADAFAVLLDAVGMPHDRLPERAGRNQRYRVRQAPNSREAAEAGLRYAYLQPTASATKPPAPRGRQLFDVKLRAIENYSAGVDIVP